MAGLIVEARETRQFNDPPPSDSSNDLASLAQNSRTLEQKLSGQNTQTSGQYNQTISNPGGNGNDVNQSSSRTARDAQHSQEQGIQSGNTGGGLTGGGDYARSQATDAENYTQDSTQGGQYPSKQTSTNMGNEPSEGVGNRTSQDSNATLIPAERSQPGSNSESHKHDTTIHRTVKPAVIHETIRPVETNIVTTNMTVHHHIHHYVHRIQPVLVSSEEEERFVHDFMGQGWQPHSEGKLYRHLGTHGEQGIENEVGGQGQTEGVGRRDYTQEIDNKAGNQAQTGDVGHKGYSQGTENIDRHGQSRSAGENIRQHSGSGGTCTACASSGNVLKGTEGGKTHNGGICRVCGNDYGDELSRGVRDMKISEGSGSNEGRNRV